jgi:hypothetical protein
MKQAIVLLAASTLTFAVAAPQAHAQPVPAAGFDALKSLAGQWHGESSDGGVTNTIRLVSNGTAVEETFENGHDNQMVTLYTPDGNRLAMTHYCSAGNQPRMQTGAVTAAQKDFDFTFSGVTNLASPDAGHMRHLTLQIADRDHFTETWTWHEKGKDLTTVIRFTRVKA